MADTEGDKEPTDDAPPEKEDPGVTRKEFLERGEGASEPTED